MLLLRCFVMSEYRCPICGSTDTKETDYINDDQGTVEYTVKCKKCETKIGIWAYGSWFPCEIQVEKKACSI